MSDTVWIVTFHNAINYGVYLQAYSLQEKVKELGYDAKILNYDRKREKENKIKRAFRRVFTDHVGPVQYYRIKSQQNKMNQFQDIIKRKQDFQRFRETYFDLTEYFDSYNELIHTEKAFSACVCGSDQIWNPEYTDFNPVYFLQFADACQRIAYAPSIGVASFNSREEKQMKELINSFGDVSIREKGRAEYWSKRAGKTVFNAIDPTLLFTKEYWNVIAQFQEQNEPYLLCYFLSYDKRYYNLIEKVRKKYGLKVYILPFCYDGIMDPHYEKLYLSIEEFLGYMGNADFILTDSFHGTAFSVNYGKNFYAIQRVDSGKKLHSRIQDFLSRLGLSDRIIDLEELDGLKIKKTDYSYGEMVLKEWRTESEGYLRNALNRAIDKTTE